MVNKVNWLTLTVHWLFSSSSPSTGSPPTIDKLLSSVSWSARNSNSLQYHSDGTYRSSAEVLDGLESLTFFNSFRIVERRLTFFTTFSISIGLQHFQFLNKGVICRCLFHSVATMPTFCVPKFRYLYVRFNECKGHFSFIHFGRLSALRWCHRDVVR